MEYSTEAVANKMIYVIIGLSVLVAAGGFFAFMLLANAENASIFSTIMGVRPGSARVADAVPFALGVGMAMGVNVVKVILMRRAVNVAVRREAGAAKFYLQQQYLLRLLITAAVLFFAGWLHSGNVTEAGNPQVINFMGVFFGIFTFPIATHSLRFFLRNELKDEVLESVSKPEKSTVQESIDKLNAIGVAELSDNASDKNKAG